MNDIIAMEGLIKRLKSAIDRGNKKEMEKYLKYNPNGEYADMYKKMLGIKNKEKEEIEHKPPTSSTPKGKAPDYIYLNLDTIKSQIKYDFTPYPKGYFKDRNMIIKQIKNDLLKLVIALTATKEFNDEARRVLNAYNSDLKKLTGKEIYEKYQFAQDNNYEPISISQLKSWYRDIETIDEGRQTYFVIGEMSQDIYICLGIHEDLAQLIALKYINYCKFDSGDGDEGCVYTYIPEKI